MKSIDIINFCEENGYQCRIQAANEENKEFTIRINLTSEDVDNYLELFKMYSCTSWIRNGGLKDPQRVLYHKYYVCQHNSVNKKRSHAQTDRNTGCMASIDIKIKKITVTTKRNDKFLKLDVPLSGIIKFKLNHNHNVGTSGSLTFMRVSEKTKKIFEGYFDNGMSPAEAGRYHESLLLLDENGWKRLADSSVNPTKNALYYLHKKWTLKNVGHVFDPMPKFEQKKDTFQLSGITIEIATNPWAAMVVTPIMKRAQQLESSKELIFCDGTSSCNRSETTMTVLLTVTKAGAIPIAVLLHDGQTTESYEQAYGLLKQNFPNAFGGNFEPACFMTDDSKAEKTALKNIFPNSIQLLCFFHVLQKEWRWLCDKKNNVSLERRQPLMHAFREIMYSETTENLNEHIERLQQEAKDYPNFWTRFETFFSRGQEWLYLHRKHLLIRGNNTKNYAEASIRILKDIILHRTKGYNYVALADFIGCVLEEYFKKKLLDVAHGRRNEIQNNYLKLCSKLNTLIKPEDMIVLGDGLYQISSSSNTFLKYMIDVSVGVCSCPEGINGSFCKHQAYLHKHLDIPFPNVPAINFRERASLGQLALGDKCPNPEWFLALNEAYVPDAHIGEDIECISPYIHNTPMEVDLKVEEEKTENEENALKDI